MDFEIRGAFPREKQATYFVSLFPLQDTCFYFFHCQKKSHIGLCSFLPDFAATASVLPGDVRHRKVHRYIHVDADTDVFKGLYEGSFNRNNFQLCILLSFSGHCVVFVKY